jgi:alpha-L-fucosidase
VAPVKRALPEILSRREFAAATLAAAAAPFARGPGAAQSRPRPSRSQLDWQREELAIFVHFGVNTFTDREWGDGQESPAVFNPSRLDARQWARAARSAGFRAMILTAKHHDGFCLWPSSVTRHSVASSPWRGGQGDLVREFVDACRAEGLRPGLYLSPWDRNASVYGDSPSFLNRRRQFRYKRRVFFANIQTDLMFAQSSFSNKPTQKPS